jgi:GNAT superfamily N-acetyltransferase
MGIRKAKISDCERIGELLNQLDYPDTDSFLQENIKTLLKHPDEKLLVYEYRKKVVALISVHFIPQLALKGDFARISYFVVDKKFRGKGIGNKMEQYCVSLAKKRKCDRIEVHCNVRRLEAHKFYKKQGYVELPKYFYKKLV